MAIRQIRLDGDPLLRKKSREVKKITPGIKTLVEDMIETMDEAQGIGIAAPQVGVLRKVIIVDTEEEGEPLAMINPVILESEGECIGVEGCLSVPNFNATVKRPVKLTVEYMDVDGETVRLEAEGLQARCICHEVDHLEGILFKDIYEKEVNLEDLEEGEYEGDE